MVYLRYGIPRYAIPYRESTIEKLKGIAADYSPAMKNEYKESILDTVIKANYEFIRSLKEEEAMSKEVLELFRPEIESEVGRRIKKVVNMLNKLNISITEIAHATELSEEEVLDIIHGK
jgi:hypothetical protein